MSKSTQQNFPFTVEGESFDSSDKEMTARDILEKAKEKDMPAAQGKVEDLSLECNGSICSGDDLIDLSQDNEFSIKVIEEDKIYRFKVNGQELEANFKELAVLDIIKIAHEKGLPLPGEPDNLLLQRIGETDGFKGNNLVDLTEDPEFLLILDATTPVA